MDPNKITYFAETDARNKRVKFGIKAKDRLKHVYVIGKTGMGKSTLLENMAVQDIQSGEGIAVIDPHGSMADKLLDYVPEHRIKDVLYFAPFDTENPISFNLLEDIGEEKRHLVVNGLMATFEKIWADAWSARMAYILANTLYALLETPGSTLLGVNRMYSDKEYRKSIVANVTNVSVKAFWTEEYAKYNEKFAVEATAAIQNKIGQFTSNALVRNIIGQPKSSFDLRKIMDEGKILIVNLSKGQVGDGNANLIGSMLITKIYLAAMSRADASDEVLSKLPNFYLYVDEFQSFANKSFANILSEARKYKLNLTIAHQYIEQMEEEVRDAVFGNVGTMITFRVGAFDAEVLEKEFSPVFTAEDLVNLGFAQIYLKLMIDGVSSQPFSATTMLPIPKPEQSFKQMVIESSRAQFSQPRAEVEKQITEFHAEIKPMPEPGKNRMQEDRQRQEGNLSPYKDKPMQAGNTSQAKPYAPQPRLPQEQHLAVVKEPLPVIAESHVPQVVKPQVDENKQAFIKAKEMLEQKVSEPHKPVVDVVVEKPVSLKELTPSHERAKVPTKENLSSLKDALSSVLKKENNDVSVPKKDEGVSSQQPIVTKEEKTQSVSPQTPIKQEPIKLPEQDNRQKEQKQVKQSEPSQAMKEVPEDILRSLLSMDDVQS